jgi:hypothetical protein
MAQNIPQSWSGYEDKNLQVSITEALKRPENPLHIVLRYTLIDTETGEGKTLLNAPHSPYLFPEPLWSPDSHSVVISETYLPLDVAEPAELLARRTKPYVVEISVPDCQMAKISDEHLLPIKWDAQTGKVLFERYQKANVEPPKRNIVAYHKGESGWQPVAVEDVKVDAAPLDITLDEDMNTPPKVIARDPVSEKRALLMDLNPQFLQLRFGRVEEITWKSSDGHEAIGELYWPADYVTRQKYPLVVQTHGFNPKRFWIDGPFASGFAAQALANRGFFVLQFDGAKDSQQDRAAGLTPRFFDYQVAAYDGAVDHLTAMGLIDPARVGLVGFSWTGSPVKYALVQAKYHYGAAVVVDGDDAGYFQYLAFANRNPDLATVFERFYGTAPFGDGLSAWLHNGPGFKFEKVRTPLMAQSVGPYSLLVEWEWFAALSRLGKPVELLYMADATHNVQKPWDRMTSQQGSVDWFCFWLKGEEDPDPEKKEQYTRWRELRKLQEKNEATRTDPKR